MDNNNNNKFSKAEYPVLAIVETTSEPEEKKNETQNETSVSVPIRPLPKETWRAQRQRQLEAQAHQQEDDDEHHDDDDNDDDSLPWSSPGSRQPLPGAERIRISGGEGIDGIQYNDDVEEQQQEEEDDGEDDRESSSVPQQQQQQQQQLQQETMVHAFLVSTDDDNNNNYQNDGGDDEPILATALVWKGYWTKKKLLVAICILVFLAITTGLIVAYTVPSFRKEEVLSSSNDNASATRAPTSPPSFSPTDAPSLFPRVWNKIGHLEPGLSEDEFGASMAMSRYGTHIAVGAIGYWEGEGEGRVNIFYYDHDNVWRNVGSIYGNQSADELGRSVSISDDGTVVAVGAPFSSDRYDTVSAWFGTEEEDAVNSAGNRSGYVQVYHYQNDEQQQNLESENRYVPMGSPILPTRLNNNVSATATEQQFGWMVDLSADGRVLAVSDRSATCSSVWMYRYNGVDAWLPMGGGRGGHHIIASCQENPSSESESLPPPITMSLSGYGSMIAIGIPSGGSSDGRGLVRFLRFDEEDATWSQLGAELMQQELLVDLGDHFGASVSLSNEGSTVAIGAPKYGDYIPGTCVNNETGLLQVFRWNNASNAWEQRGQNLLGNSVFDHFGSGVSLSADASIVAGGATGSNDNGENSGHVRVFQYNDLINDWELIGGGAVAGPVAQGEAGDVLALSHDGHRLGIGVTPIVTTDLTGYVQIFELGIVEEAGTFPIYVEHELPWPEWSLERVDVTTQERVFLSDSGGCCLDSNTTIQVQQKGLYKLSMIDYDWYWKDVAYEESSNSTFSLRNGNDETGALLASGYTNYSSATNIYFVADTANVLDKNVIVTYGFDNMKSQSVISRGMELFDNDNATMAERAPPPPPQLKLEIHFGEQPERIELILKVKNQSHHPQTGRLVQEESLVAFGAEYGSHHANQVVVETIDLGRVPLNHSSETSFVFSFTEELNEQSSYSAVCLFNVSTTIHATDKLLWTLEAAAEERHRKTTWTFSYYF
jgi:hypothetical protein